MNSSSKHYLDSSVVRPLLTASVKYKEYLNREIAGKKYAHPYVQMEVKRSYIITCINFYAALNMPSFDTVNDVIAYWSNKFKPGEIKAVLQLIPQITKVNKIDLNSKKDKSRAAQVLMNYIIRFDVILRNEFKTPGKNAIHCKRAGVGIKAGSSSDDEALNVFHYDFMDVASCRAGCKVEDFFLKRHKNDVQNYIAESKAMKKSDNKGFFDIATKLEKVMSDGGSVLNCRFCGGIGDAVIALDAERSMQLEHTDSSFNNLCPSIKQPNPAKPEPNFVVFYPLPQ